MRPPIFILCIALVALCLVVRGASAHQHITNGGFEQGLAAWTTAPTTDLRTATAPEMAPAEGAASARITLGASDAIVRQRVGGALPAGSYTLSAQVRSPESASITLSMLLAGSLQQIVVATDSAPPAWTEIGGTFALRSAEEVIVSIIASGATGTEIYLDNIRLDGAAPVTLTPTRTAVPATLIPANEVTAVALTPPAIPSAPATPAPVTADVIGPDVRNGSFEQVDDLGVPVAWEKFGGTLAADGRAHGGGRAARLHSATSSTKWLHQAVTVDPGGWYALEAWILLEDSGIASAFLRVSWYASADGGGEALSTDDSTEALDAPSSAYQRLTTGALRPPQDARSARVRVLLAPASEAPASMVVDDVTWQRVPAPIATAIPLGPTVAPAAAVEGAPRVSAVESAPSTSRRAGGRTTTARLTGAAVASDAGVIINEILYDSATADVADSDLEWVELFNASDVPVDITGWSLADAVGADVLPHLVVPSRGFAIFAATDAFAAAYPDIDAETAVLAGRIGNGLGNDGDRLLLIDPSGAIVDAVSWGDDASAFDPSVHDVPSGHSIERRMPGADSDAAADFVDNERPSPGAAYDPAPTAPAASAGVPTIEILSGSGARNWGWLPWAMAATAMAICLGMLGWRAAFAVRERLRPP